MRDFQSCYQGLSLRGEGQDFFLKTKAKDMKIFQGQGQDLFSQGQGHKIFSRPTETVTIRAKICIAVTETKYANLIKHNAKETILTVLMLNI